MRKIFKLTLILAVAATVFMIAAISVNATEPILISSADQLQSMTMDGNYQLSQDIDLEGFDFTPVGTKEAPFAGTLDGNGHKITGLSFTEAAQSVGLFGFISNGTVMNLTVEDASVVIDNAGVKYIDTADNNKEKTYDMSVGIICGYSDGDTLFKNCRVSGTVNVKYGGKKTYVAGISGQSAGMLGAVPSYDMCRNEADITVDSSKYSSTMAYGSGLVAEGMYASITYSENIGNISVKAKLGVQAAGISAAYGQESVTKCANSGNITANSVNGVAEAGGIIATAMYGKVIDCYNAGDVSAVASSENATAGGICASCWSGNTFDRCYNVGNVTVSENGKCGALIGMTSTWDKSYKDNYMLDSLTADSIGENNLYGTEELSAKDSVTKLSDAQLQSEESFAEGYDFIMVWYINTDGEYKYPKIRKLKFGADIIKGDADGDDNITASDGVALARYLANYDGFERIGDIGSSDLNKDGKVSSIDLITLSRHIAMWHGYETLPLN